MADQLRVEDLGQDEVFGEDQIPRDCWLRDGDGDGHGDVNSKRGNGLHDKGCELDGDQDEALGNLR